MVYGLASSTFANPVISELMASNSSTLADEDGNASDWIEIHNPDTNSVNLDGWYLTDDPANLTKWRFPATSIPAGGYLIVFASDENRASAGNELHTNFKLSSDGEYLALIQPDGSTIATAFSPDYPALQTDVSYGIPQGTQREETVINTGANLLYHVPSESVNDWNANSFNDSLWTPGHSGIGYDTDSSYGPYILTDIQAETYNQTNAYSTYLRLSFHVTDPSKVTGLEFLAKYDDGFAAYINGQLISSENAPENLSWNSRANSSREADLANFQSWDASSLIPHLVAGDNTLAIQMLNQNISSSDFLMIPKLKVTTTVEQPAAEYQFFIQPTPGAINNTPAGEPAGPVTISEASGIKTSSITLNLTPTEPDAEIRYTLDGSEPNESSLLYTTPLSLSDPAQLCTRAYTTGKVGGPIARADYSFIDPSLLTYTSNIPIIVMDNFGAGSYPNKGRTSDGSNVQQVARQANVMSIFDASPNSQPFSQAASIETRAGCRTRGSSSTNFPRKPLSVEFWDNADNDRSLSPFGMHSEADWVLYAPYDIYDKSLLHNPVSFELAKRLGALAPNSKVVAVFQNKDGGKITASDMNGVYIFMEKIERNRAGADFSKMNDSGTDGGWMIKVDRMAAIPVGMPADTVQPNFHAAGRDGILSIPDDQESSGGSQSVDDISTFYHSYLNFANPDGYDILTAQRDTVQTAVRAMDAAVWANDYDDPVTGYAAHLDADSWARYYAVHNFTKNNDSIVLSTHLFCKSPHSTITMGPVWDFDRAYTQNGSATNSPLYNANRDWFDGLFEDINFSQIHQDLWQEARRTTLTNSDLENIVDEAASGLRSDQIVASGLSYSTWLSRVTDMKTWMVNRAEYLDSQYEPLPKITPETEIFSDSLLVTITPTDGGSVYFTTDGSDPRAPGGGISASAQLYTTGLTFTERTRVIARTKDGADWSGTIDRTFYQLSEIPQLVISEIGYHPALPTPDEVTSGFLDADDFEYLEIQNIGLASADLSTLILSEGISFDFATASQSTLAPGARILLVRNLAAFEARYGNTLPTVGEYQGALNNAGDQITLSDPLIGVTLQNFLYDDDAPWPTAADGTGYSLILRRPETNPDHNLASNWRCSSLLTGNPGTSDSRPDFAGNTLQDLDGDGVSALVEHFLGTSDQDPGEGSDRYQITMLKLPAEGLTYPVLEVTYTIGADDIGPDAIWSQDMASWSALTSEIVLVSHTLNGDGTATLIWRSTTPNTSSPQFFRLKVNQF